MHFRKWAEGLVLEGCCRIVVCQQLPGSQLDPLAEQSAGSPSWQGGGGGSWPQKVIDVIRLLCIGNLFKMSNASFQDR